MTKTKEIIEFNDFFKSQVAHQRQGDEIIVFCDFDDLSKCMELINEFRPYDDNIDAELSDNCAIITISDLFFEGIDIYEIFKEKK
jgi:hypothetical protein